MSAKGSGGTERKIPVRAQSIEMLAADHPIGFPAPLVEHSTNPDAFEFNWHLIQFVFGLQDPRSFPAFAGPLPEDSLAVLRRYRVAARDLAESAFLAHPTGVTVNVLDGNLDEQIEEGFPPRENVRGFSVLSVSFIRTKKRLASIRYRVCSGV